MEELFSRLFPQQQQTPVGNLQGALDRLIKSTSERWRVLDAASPSAIMDDFKIALSHLEAFGAKEEILKKYQELIDWYEGAAAGDRIAGLSLARVPKDLRAYARVIRYLLWIEGADADKPRDAYVLLHDKLFTEEVWDKLRVESIKEVDEQSREIIDLVKGLAVFNNNTPFPIIRTSFEVIKAKHDKLDKGDVFPRSVLDWVCGQVVKIALATNVEELTAVLLSSPYTGVCKSLLVWKSKSCRKLLKALRVALFARYDELVA